MNKAMKTITIKAGRSQFDSLVWILILIWTLIIGTSLLWNIAQLKKSTLEMARIQARTAHEKDVIYRRWNTDHSGVYVPATEKTPPNPHLDVPDRDITTPGGKRLTLMNPAEMTRQAHELGEKKLEVRGHITSLNPIRPENAPDPWEREVLNAFERGQNEVSALQERDGRETLRLMRPLSTEKGCLKCHAKQGYREGDIRGGISVTIPMEPLRILERAQINNLVLAHVVLWLLGLAGIVIGTSARHRSELQTRRMEQSLVDSEERLRLVTDNMLDLVFHIDPAGVIRYASPSHRTILGYEPEEVVGKSIFDSLHPEDLDRVKGLWEQGFPPESIRNIVFRCRHGEGHYLWLDTYGNPVLDSKEVQAGVVLNCRDITERRQAEEALRESQELFAKLIATIPDIVVRTDMNGQVLYLNDVALQINGYSREEIEGQNLLHFIAAEDRERIIKNLMLMVDHPLGPQEYHLIMKDGRRVLFEVNGDVLRNPNGEPYGTVNVCRDISERKQAEEEKSKLQAQFIQAQKMESIGTLAGGVAHDFNNILTTIQGYAELAALSLCPDNPLCEPVMEIQRASKRAANLTRQLLLFSRKQPMDIRPLNLNDTLNNLMKMLRRLIGEDIAIETDLRPDLLPISGDSGNIEQVIMNLVVNARDAMPEGGIIRIKTENVHIDRGYLKLHSYARSGSFVCLSITDTGLGMVQDTIQHIFDPFFTTKELGRGTGLGLSVVYGIVQQHKGWVQVYSEPGQGSVFKVYLPVSYDPTPEEMASEAVSLKDLMGKGERILVVEDDAGIRYFVETLLLKFEYKIRMAGDAEEALCLFQQEKAGFDLVLSDVVLPGKSGLLLMEELLACNPNLKILLSSGYTDQKSQWAVIKEKGHPFIQKPYRLVELLKSIKEALGTGISS